MSDARTLRAAVRWAEAARSKFALGRVTETTDENRINVMGREHDMADVPALAWDEVTDGQQAFCIVGGRNQRPMYLGVSGTATVGSASPATYTT